jgi:hypothetical protein
MFCPLRTVLTASAKARPFASGVFLIVKNQIIKGFFKGSCKRVKCYKLFNELLGKPSLGTDVAIRIFITTLPSKHSIMANLLTN